MSTKDKDQGIMGRLATKLNEPSPTPIQKVVPVEEKEKKPEKVPFNTTLPKEIKKLIDIYCAEKDIYQHQLIADAVTEYVQNHP